MSEEQQVKRPEMGLSHADFLRIFPRLLVDAEYSTSGLEPEARWADGRRLRVSVSAQHERKIALMRIPYVNICFWFHGFSAVEQADFLARFDRAFQKGGG